MNYYFILSSFLLAVLVTVLFSILLGSRGLFVFFLIIFFAGFAAQLWLAPTGPNIWGISVLPLLVVGLIFSLLIISIFAMTNPLPKYRNGEAPLEYGFLVYALLIVMIGAVIAGVYHYEPVIDQIKEPYITG
ncbi:MAG TPA: hypothetical protein VD905_02585 [Flavobacteriales bacterium]|nr:hypothetical protein [Flavobacteriales bacterium]